MDKEVKTFIKDIKNAFLDAKILLFGSRAKGTARTDSDYDFIVISRHFEKVSFADRSYEIWSKSKANVSADVLCYAPGEIEKIKSKSVVLKDALKHAVSV